VRIQQLARLGQKAGMQIPVDEALPLCDARSTTHHDGNEHGRKHNLPDSGAISM
jgi:hypothetical protein